MNSETKKALEELGRECPGYSWNTGVLRATIISLEAERDALRAQVERLTSPVPGLAESGPYTLADVDAIEAHRGKPYARLRATVQQVERVRRVAKRLKHEEGDDGGSGDDVLRALEGES